MGVQGNSVLQSALIDKVALTRSVSHAQLKTIKYSFRQTATMVNNQNHNRFPIYEVDSKAHAEPKRQATRC